MAPFIFGARNNIHIVDLAQTVPLMHQALVAVSDVVAKGGRVLFVGTKRQAGEAVADAAKRSAQYYINHRWLGGTLTNWKTISQSIRRLRQLDEMIRGATPPIYEVLQPHLRRAQSLGLRLAKVPTHEVTGVTIEEHEAGLLNRVLSLLTSNAINAGATELSVELHLPEGALYVVVSDDAGGFDLASVPQGRGLHRLMAELGPDAVVRGDAPAGSMMIVRLPRNGPAAGTPACDARPTRQALA